MHYARHLLLLRSRYGVRDFSWKAHLRALNHKQGSYVQFVLVRCVNSSQVANIAIADMPSAAGTMNGSLPAIATLLFIFLPVAFLIILYVKNPGTE